MMSSRGQHEKESKLSQPSYIGLKQNMLGYSMIGPAMIFFLLFLVFPVFKAFQVSLYKYSGIGPMTNFVGLQNLWKGLADKDFLSAILHTLTLTGVDLLVSMTVAFFLAYFLYLRIPGWKFFSVSLYFPSITPIIVAALIWRQMYEPTQGLINSALRLIHLDSLTALWLSSPKTALASVIIAWIWRTIPFLMLVLYSGMFRIPDELLESAKIDGASQWEIIRHIILPLVMPMMNILAIFTIATDFRSFDMVWVLTQPGIPGGPAEIATTYVYRQAVSYYEYGYANALGILVFFIVGGLIFLLWRLTQKHITEASL